MVSKNTTMDVCVFGLWHLGCVTAACVAEQFPTTACDPDAAAMARLKAGDPPVFEPGLTDLLSAQVAAGRLTFMDDIREAVRRANLVWVTFDTPVNEDDIADPEFVARQIRSIFEDLQDGTLVLISSQVPVGFTAAIEAEFRSLHPHRNVNFAYSPENLRLGKALDSFRNAQRIVAGVRSQDDRRRLEEVLARFCGCVEWMSVESAEMTKHALNAFLACSVAFINEIASLGEFAGADAKEVERGLKSDVRIGGRAYLSPGGSFAGGTLARDVSALGLLADRAAIPAHLLRAIAGSNQAHKEWPRRKLRQLLGDLRGKTIAVLGLTYKPGTDTLRRSLAVELCQWLKDQGAVAQAYDPAVRQLPPELGASIRLCPELRNALADADAVVIATEWPEFRQLSGADLQSMRGRVVIDPNRFLNDSVRQAGGLVYAAVGYQGNRG